MFASRVNKGCRNEDKDRGRIDDIVF